MNLSKFKKLVIESILLFSIFFSFSYVFVYYHELVHERIYSYYGIESEKLITPLYGHVIPNEEQFSSFCENYPKACKDIAFLQLLTEIVGYHTVIIFSLNGIYALANPQLKELSEIHSMKNACAYLRNELGIKQANVIGDADFGIGWWCKYNFTNFKDYFKRKPFEKFDFVLDSWWNFSASPVQNYNEYEDIEKINKSCSLVLVWDDGKKEYGRWLENAC